MYISTSVCVSVSSTVLACDVVSTTVNASTDLSDAGPVIVNIDDAELVSSDIFSYDDEPVVLDVSPRVSIRRYNRKLSHFSSFMVCHIVARAGGRAPRTPGRGGLTYAHGASC